MDSDFYPGGFWLHPVSFFITGLVLLAGAQYEYYLIIKNTGIHPQMITGMIVGCSLYIISTLVASGIIEKEYFLFLIPLALIIMIVELFRKQEKPFDSLAHTFFAIFYIAIPFLDVPVFSIFKNRFQFIAGSS